MNKEKQITEKKHKVFFFVILFIHKKMLLKGIIEFFALDCNEENSKIGNTVT